MAKISGTEKWKKRTLTALSVALAASLSMGVFAACAPTSEESEEEDAVVSRTDEQLLRNGNFEFYSDNNLTDVNKKFNVISSPNNWTFTSGSPASNASSGIINTAEWAYFTQTGGYPFKTFTKGEGDDAEEVTTFESIAEAVAHWEDDNVSAYDRIKFYDIFDDEIDDLSSSSEAKKLFAKYNYSVSYKDVKNLHEDLPNGVAPRTGAAEDETSVLMIHNDRNVDTEDVRGTAQYYTSSTTITLAAGTAAKLSVWVKTDNLYHYEDTVLKGRGGAYIGVTNTVGGSEQEQMQIYNISTEGVWKEYTLYVRASTFATTTIRVVLGLGQGNSDDRYYSVDGYAFFDDVKCELITGEKYAETVSAENNVYECTIDSLKAQKQLPVDEAPYNGYSAFALNLYAGFPINGLLSNDNVNADLTKEKSGRNEYTSASIDPSLGNDDTQNFTGLTDYEELSSPEMIDYVKNVFENDFKDQFPFGEKEPVVMLLSGNGAAYTAKITPSQFTLAEHTRMLISFFAKTSAVESGLTGASATIVDGDTKTNINAFDTTKLATVDIDDENEDIYKGWTQCFFFLENDTDSEKTFSLELSLGPTTIIGTNKFSYGDGYAAFTKFEAKVLSKTEYGYASTGDRAVKVSLTGGVEETKRFDTVSAADENTLKEGLAIPAHYNGVLGGSNFIVNGGDENEKPESILSGLLSSKYAENYFEDNEAAWRSVLNESADNADEWWQKTFGNARQPLVIINTEKDVSYGYFAKDPATISTSSYQRISLRVKASAGASAFIYLIDTSENAGKSLSPAVPSYTYWYDDDGNIVNMDPSDEKFDDDGKILYELQDNGLYKAVGDVNDNYYANLHNLKKDNEGNLVVGSQIVFFLGADGEYYAYRDEDANGNYAYRTLVHNLPTDVARQEYDYSNKDALPSAQMEVIGTGKWITVSFYVHTADVSKSYRVEVWNGSRDGKVTNPANSYVLFDNFNTASASSNYSDLLAEKVADIKDILNDGKTINDDGFIREEDNLPKAEDGDFYQALYYTYTFFDSAAYVRYDETTDEDELGNPWGSFKQSDYSEQLLSLFYRETRDDETSYSLFLDYASVETTVEADDLGVEDDTNDGDTSTSSGALGDTNIWLLISSGILAVVLIAVIILVIVRRLLENRKRKTRVASQVQGRA